MPSQDASDRRSLGLYVVLARDVCDFMDMIMEEDDVEALKTLYLMLTTANPKTPEADRRLNEFGAPSVARRLEVLGEPLPAPVSAQQPAGRQGEFRF